MSISIIASVFTSSDESYEKPSSCKKFARTRNIFQPGLDCPTGGVTAENDCIVFSIFMNVPDVSVNGVIGNTTSNSLKESDMYGEIARLNFAFLSAEFIFLGE